MKKIILLFTLLISTISYSQKISDMTEVTTTSGNSVIPIVDYATGQNRKMKLTNAFSTVTAGWGLSGNSATIDGTNFIGTIDNIPFNIRVNNEKSGSIDASLFNTFYGYQSGNSNTTGASCVGIGYRTLYLNTIGIKNTALGLQSLYSNVDGEFNIGVGFQGMYSTTSGDGNIGIGHNSGITNTTGNYNTCIGELSDVGSSGLSNATAIGYSAVVSTSNSIVLGASGVNVGIGTSSPSVMLDLGTAGSDEGDIRLAGASSGNLTIKTASATATYTLRLPPDDGTPSQVLQTDGSGVTSWVTVASTPTITVGSTAIASGTTGAIPFNSAGVYQEDATQLFWDNTNNRLGIGTASPDFALDVTTSDLSYVADFNSTHASGVSGIKLTAGAQVTGLQTTIAGAGTPFILGIYDGTAGSYVYKLDYAGAMVQNYPALGTVRHRMIGSSQNTNFGIESGSKAFYIYDDTFGAYILNADLAGNWGMGGVTPSARLHVKGSGATSATSSLLVENSAGTDALQISDDLRSIFSGRIEGKQGADVASVAGAIALGYDGNTFEITGTNAITLISNLGWQNGAEIVLVFTSTATLTDGTANSGTDIGMELAGGANFTGSADDIVTLKLCEVGGTQRWREKSRSVN